MATALIAIEDKKALDRIDKIVSEMAFDTITASDREAARTLMRESPVDLVIVSGGLAGKDGVAFSQEVRATKGASYMPVVILSDAVGEDLVVRALGGGADYVLGYDVPGKILGAVIEARGRVKQSFDWLSREVEKDYEEFEMARKVQEKLLPSRYPDIDKVKFAARYVPTEHVGGDFYDIISHEDDSVGLFISDVSGHGVHAAFTTMSIKTALNTWARGVVSPSETFIMINNLVNGIVSVGKFVTAFYAKLDLDNFELNYSNAGHPPALLFRKGVKKPEQLDTETGFPLGITTASMYQEKTVALSPGDKLFMYTDGIDEARNPASELYGEERLIKCFARNLDKDIDGILDGVLADVKAFADGVAFYDDINLLGLEVLG